MFRLFRTLSEEGWEGCKEDLEEIVVAGEEEELLKRAGLGVGGRTWRLGGRFGVAGMNWGNLMLGDSGVREGVELGLCFYDSLYRLFESPGDSDSRISCGGPNLNLIAGRR